MKYEYTKNKKIEYSECNKYARLGLVSTFSYAENMATEYFGTFKSDNVTLRKENNAAWVYTKVLVHIIEEPKWNDDVICKSYTILHTRVKTRVETIIQDKTGKIFAVAVQESCPMDLAERKIRKIETISYPQDMEDEESVSKEQFSILRDSFEESDFACTQTVQACDIDFTNHTNNVMYVKYILNSFKSDYWDDKKITDFEIHYLKETKEGNVLKIYKKKTDENTFEFLLKNGDIESARAKLKFE